MTSSQVRLVCPLCTEQVSAGAPPEPGHCPHCHARFEGDGESAPEAVALALEAFGLEDMAAGDVATALFTVTPQRAREIGFSIASDERDGFYRWWVFLRDGADPRETVSRLSDAARA